MDVKEVILTAAGLLGFKKELEGYLSSASTMGKQKIDEMVDCFNLVESELALDYLPLRIQEECEVIDGKVAYEHFSQYPAHVTSVKKTDGESLKFVLFPTEIALDTLESKVLVEYSYLPQKKSVLDESDYQSRANVGLMAYGVAAAYCAAQGLYTESAFWDKKYKESVALACVGERKDARKRVGRMGSRKWV